MNDKHPDRSSIRKPEYIGSEPHLGRAKAFLRYGMKIQELPKSEASGWLKTHFSKTGGFHATTAI
ncbi:hypothetical protein Thiosp_04199 [Thiorhodovibrio litoralis]|nr:hypothetical protein Thiosp_04199 [Thiorhodovibrio litoralis]